MKIIDTMQFNIMPPSDIANPQRELFRQYNATFANLEHTDYAAYAARARRLQGQAFKAFFGGLWSALSHHLQVRRIENQLAALPDRTLSDIGLSREQIPAAARGAYKPQSDHILTNIANTGLSKHAAPENTKVAA